jgi:hypothetical protein
MADYSHKMSSLVREFFLNGYETVVAPAWDLSVKVPPIWLREFLSGIATGETVSVAHQAATLLLHQTGMFIDDWACLQIYGNPYLRFSPAEK